MGSGYQTTGGVAAREGGANALAPSYDIPRAYGSAPEFRRDLSAPGGRLKAGYRTGERGAWCGSVFQRWWPLDATCALCPPCCCGGRWATEGPGLLRWPSSPSG